ncbi:hypothetical protein GBA52_008609 [Prunus armeniaca]|nr:hypothetical protein GBA52_008609 [Prunus armeniaca]
MHHGGKWFEDCYKDGYVTWFDYVDKDALSLFEIYGMVETLGYDGYTLHYYKEPDNDYFNGLQLLQTDEGSENYNDSDEDNGVEGNGHEDGDSEVEGKDGEIEGEHIATEDGDEDGIDSDFVDNDYSLDEDENENIGIGDDVYDPLAATTKIGHRE